MSEGPVIADLDDRSRDVFRRLVETYLSSGEPVGSRTLSQGAALGVSPATIRNVMADLTDMGLLYSPHISAGRLPTERGLRLFVDGLMEIGDLTPDERAAIEREIGEGHATVEDALSEAATRLSGLARTASLVMTPTGDGEAPVKHIEFVSAGPNQSLVVLVGADGKIENRLVAVPFGLTPSALEQAGNFLNARLRGRSLAEAREEVLREIESERSELDRLTAKLVEAGVAERAGDDASLIVRGRAHLLDDAQAEDIERVRMLFDDLEKKQEVIELLQAARAGDGVRIFIGSENRLFSLSGSSVIAAPYRDASRRIVGVVGVIGPTRLNYARVIPLVNHTAEVVSRVLK